MSNWSDRDDHHHAGRVTTNLANGFASPNHSSEQDFAKTGPITNRGRKKELLLEDVGGSFPKAAPSFGGAKGKRSERDPSGRNTKAGRGPNNKGDRKVKAKPKQKAGPLSASANVSVNGSNNMIVKREAESVPKANGNPLVEEGKVADLAELSTELGVANGIIDENQDLSSWWEEEDGGLLEDFSMGLDLPMDDLSEVLS